MRRRLAAAAVTGGTLATALAASPAQAAVDGLTATAKAKTYTGVSVSTPFGPVQVRIVVRSSKVLSVTAVSYPNRDPRSASISAYAIPRLQQQAMAAQSARIDGVSGASYTTAGFEQSLQSALTAAGLA